MRRTNFLVCIIAVCGGLSAVAHSNDSPDAEKIAEIRARSNDAIRAQDVDGIVAAYDETYQLTTGSGLLFHDNPETEKELWAEHFAQLPDVVYVRTPTTIHISTYLPRAAESGKWVGTWTTDKGPVEVRGTYSASWIKVSGQWKIQSEMFVSLYCSGGGCQIRK